MSYDIDLSKDGKIVKIESRTDLGTMLCFPPSEEADYNITYNYSNHYYKHFPDGLGIKWLHEKKGADCIKTLESVIDVLGTQRSNDYWESTPGNAGYALSVLLEWAKQHPDATFEVW